MSVTERVNGTMLSANRISEAGSGRTFLPDRVDAAEMADGNARVVTRSLLVGLGGTGVNVVSQVKQMCKSQKTANFSSWLGIDTDRNAQQGVDGGLSLEDSEFLHVPPELARNIIEHPEQHQELEKRYDLQEKDVRAFCEKLVAAALAQGSQVRTYGNMALQANWTRVRETLRRKLADLTSVWEDLNVQMQHKQQLLINQETKIYVVCSMAGGTGSSMLLETLAMLREMARDYRCQIAVFLVTSATYSGVLQGQSDQVMRVEANCYAMAMELLAASRGQLVDGKDNLQLGPDARQAIELVGNLWDEIYVLQSADASGRQYENPQAVSDRCALLLAGLIGTEIASSISRYIANQRTSMQNLPDRVTGLSRELGTIGAQALSLNTVRTSEVLTDRCLGGVMQSAVLGENKGTAVETTARTVCREPGEGAIPISAAALTDSLQKTAPDAVRKSETLLRSKSGTSRTHDSAANLVRKTGDMLRNHENAALPQLRDTCARDGANVGRIWKVAVGKKGQAVLTASGLRSAQLYFQQVLGEVEKQAEAAEGRKKQELTAARRTKDQISALQQQLGRRLRWWPADRPRKDALVAAVADYLRASCTAECSHAAAETFRTLADVLRGYIGGVEKRVETSRNRLRQLQQTAVHTSTLTAGSEGEIDITTPHVVNQLFSKLCPETTEVIDLLKEEFGVSDADVISGLAGKPEFYAKAKAVIRRKFDALLSSINITDVLVELLQKPESRKDTSARIREAVSRCQPMWQADPGQIGVEFSDTLIIGLPRSENSGNNQLIRRMLGDAAIGQINPNAQYRAVPQMVDITDQSRIYILRMTIGACWHYLREMRTAERSYNEWNRIGSHSVHIFSRSAVSKMSRLIPEQPKVKVH